MLTQDLLGRHNTVITVERHTLKATIRIHDVFSDVLSHAFFDAFDAAAQFRTHIIVFVLNLTDALIDLLVLG